MNLLHYETIAWKITGNFYKVIRFKCCKELNKELITYSGIDRIQCNLGGWTRV